jgi:uncharacterized protein (DUF433 family)
MTNRPSVVHSDPEILGGTPVFVGTRVPLRNLFDYLERGHDIDEFLDAFPSVSREQAIAVLERHAAGEQGVPPIRGYRQGFCRRSMLSAPSRPRLEVHFR